jgi:Helix-loop-helix DNA-binding domain
LYAVQFDCTFLRAILRELQPPSIYTTTHAFLLYRITLPPTTVVTVCESLISIMEESHSMIGSPATHNDDEKSSTSRSELNNESLRDNLNIATMTDFQFSESLDALVDSPYSEYDTTTAATTTKIPVESQSTFSKRDINETTVVLDQQQPVAVNDCYHSLPMNNTTNGTTTTTTTTTNNNSQQFQAPPQTATSNIFFQNNSTLNLPFTMPVLGFHPNTFMSSNGGDHSSSNGSSNNGSTFLSVPQMTMPTMTLQQSIEAFGQSFAAQNMYPVSTTTTSMPSFAMCVPSNAYVTTTAPMVASNASITHCSITAGKRGQQHVHNHNATFPAISEDESDFRKRKSDRNAREQQRAQQVTDQIAHLRDLILGSGVALDKIDKFSTLIAVEKYIRSLQTKSLELKAEHDSLLLTLQQTTEHVNSRYVSSSSQAVATVSSGGEESRRGEAHDQTDDDDEDSDGGGIDAPLMKEINYKWIFDFCSFASSVTSIDGRFLDCNKEFEVLSGFTRAELLRLDHISSNNKSDVKTNGTDAAEPPTEPPKASRNMSIFNILQREHIERLFCAMSKVLQKSSNNDSDDDEEEEDNNNNNDEDACSDTITQEVDLCKQSNQKVCAKRLSELIFDYTLWV